MEATQNRTKDMSRDSANHCETCGANFPNEEALHSHANMVHYGNWNTDRPRGQRPMIDKSPPSEEADREAGEDPSESKDDDAESPPPREMPGRESDPAGKQPTDELSWRSPHADKRRRRSRNPWSPGTGRSPEPAAVVRLPVRRVRTNGKADLRTCPQTPGIREKAFPTGVAIGDRRPGKGARRSRAAVHPADPSTGPTTPSQSPSVSSLGAAETQCRSSEREALPRSGLPAGRTR